MSDVACNGTIYDSQTIRRFIGIVLAQQAAPDATTLEQRLLEDRDLTAQSSAPSTPTWPSAAS